MGCALHTALEGGVGNEARAVCETILALRLQRQERRLQILRIERGEGFVDHRWHGEQGGAGVEEQARMSDAVRFAADLVLRFEKCDLDPTLGERGRRGQAANPATDDCDFHHALHNTNHALRHGETKTRAVKTS